MSTWTRDNYRQHPAINAYGTIVKNPQTGLESVRPIRCRFKLHAHEDAEFRSILSDAHVDNLKGNPWSYELYVKKCWSKLLIDRTPTKELLSGDKEAINALKNSKQLDPNVLRALKHFVLGISGTGETKKELWATTKMEGQRFHHHHFWEFPEVVAYAVFSSATINGASAWLKDCAKNLQEKHKAMSEAKDPMAQTAAHIAKVMTLKNQFGFTGDKTIKAAKQAKPQILDIAKEAGFDFGL